jgi:hypothetical protein
MPSSVRLSPDQASSSERSSASRTSAVDRQRADLDLVVAGELDEVEPAVGGRVLVLHAALDLEVDPLDLVGGAGQLGRGPARAGGRPDRGQHGHHQRRRRPQARPGRGRRWPG